MKREHAYEAIKAILAAIDDDEISQPSKIEQDGDQTVVWFGGTGYHLGSAKRNGKHEPLIYRDRAAWQALDLEAVCRIDAKGQAA
jgi:hypothetical protein